METTQRTLDRWMQERVKMREQERLPRRRRANIKHKPSADLTKTNKNWESMLSDHDESDSSSYDQYDDELDRAWDYHQDLLEKNKFQPDNNQDQNFNTQTLNQMEIDELDDKWRREVYHGIDINLSAAATKAVKERERSIEEKDSEVVGLLRILGGQVDSTNSQSIISSSRIQNNNLQTQTVTVTPNQYAHSVPAGSDFSTRLSSLLQQLDNRLVIEQQNLSNAESNLAIAVSQIQDNFLEQCRIGVGNNITMSMTPQGPQSPNDDQTIYQNPTSDHLNALASLNQQKERLEQSIPNLELKRRRQMTTQKRYLQFVQAMLQKTDELKEIIFETGVDRQNLPYVMESFEQLSRGLRQEAGERGINSEENGVTVGDSEAAIGFLTPRGKNRVQQQNQKGGKISSNSESANSSSDDSNTNQLLHAHRVCFQRFGFLLQPLKDSLLAQLSSSLSNLKAEWPLPMDVNADDDFNNASGSSGQQYQSHNNRIQEHRNTVVQLLSNLLRLQNSFVETQKVVGSAGFATSSESNNNSNMVNNTGNNNLLTNSDSNLPRTPRSQAAFQDAQKQEQEAAANPTWLFAALAAPLVTNFKYHFCRPQSTLARLDKPQYALQYLTLLCIKHVTKLSKWIELSMVSEMQQQQNQDGSRSGSYGPEPGSVAEVSEEYQLQQQKFLHDLARGLIKELTKSCLSLFLKANYPSFVTDHNLFNNLTKELNKFIPQFKQEVGDLLKSISQNLQQSPSDSQPIDDLEWLHKDVISEEINRDFYENMSVVYGHDGMNLRKLLSLWIEIDAEFFRTNLADCVKGIVQAISKEIMMVTGRVQRGSFQNNSQGNSGTAMLASGFVIGNTSTDIIATSSSGSTSNINNVKSKFMAELQTHKDFLLDLCRALKDRPFHLLAFPEKKYGRRNYRNAPVWEAQQRYFNEVLDEGIKIVLINYLKSSWNTGVIEDIQGKVEPQDVKVYLEKILNPTSVDDGKNDGGPGSNNQGNANNAQSGFALLKTLNQTRLHTMDTLIGNQSITAAITGNNNKNSINPFDSIPELLKPSLNYPRAVTLMRLESTVTGTVSTVFGPSNNGIPLGSSGDRIDYDCQQPLKQLNQLRTLMLDHITECYFRTDLPSKIKASLVQTVANYDFGLGHGTIDHRNIGMVCDKVVPQLLMVGQDIETKRINIGSIGSNSNTKSGNLALGSDQSYLTVPQSVQLREEAFYHVTRMLDEEIKGFYRMFNDNSESDSALLEQLQVLGGRCFLDGIMNSGDCEYPKLRSIVGNYFPGIS